MLHNAFVIVLLVRGCLDSFSFGCLNVGVYLSCSQGFSLICSLFRARLCWGGGVSVAIEGFVLYAGGDYALHLNIMLLVQVMALDMRTGIRSADWCARGSDIVGGWHLCRRLESQSSQTVS